MTLPAPKPKKHIYQAMFLLDNQEARKGLNAARDWLRRTLERHGLEVKVLRFWGERRLAYRIGRRRRAAYLLAWLEGSGTAVNAAKRDLYLVGPVFRCLFVREEVIPEEELAVGIQDLDQAGIQIPEDVPEAAPETELAAEAAPAEGAEAEVPGAAAAGQAEAEAEVEGIPAGAGAESPAPPATEG